MTLSGYVCYHWNVPIEIEDARELYNAIFIDLINDEPDVPEDTLREWAFEELVDTLVRTVEVEGMDKIDSKVPISDFIVDNYDSFVEYLRNKI